MINNFENAKNKIVNSALNKAAQYLLLKYGSAHISDNTKVDLSSTIDPNSSEIQFYGHITCYASPDGVIEPIVGVNMSINSNEIEVESEESVQTKIETALNSQTEAEPITASLDSFKLVDNGSSYLQVKHAALADAAIGVVGQAEYSTSRDKVSLLKSIVKDAFPQTKIAFEGSFVEPIIEIEAKEIKHYCHDCKKPIESGSYCDACKKVRKKEDEDLKKTKKSWLTADLGDSLICPNCNGEAELSGTGENISCFHCGYEGPKKEVSKPISISENMPMARMSDHLAQSLQAEAQFVNEAQEKIKTEAVNALVSMLHGLGYGTAKVAEVSMADNKIDAMVTLDDAGTVKAVNIPVEIKADKVVLPKKTLVTSLISNGLDINAKLSEEFGKQVLERIAAEEARVQFEQEEANSILAERPVVKKEASGYDNTQFLGDQDIMELQKHLIPNHEDLKKGDKISDGSSQWEIIDTEWQQNDKNKDSASIWKLRKCKAPESDKKEPETKIKI